MKIQLNAPTKADFEDGSKWLKKAARRGEVRLDDCAHLATSLLAVLKKNPALSPTEHQILDEAMGTLMGLEEREPA